MVFKENINVVSLSIDLDGIETNGEKQCKCLAKYIENDIRGSFHSLDIDFAGIQRFLTGFCQ
ncbi:hypothetical protein CFP56_025869 [Quercus suber]|uniref:Uncharacterized protein n=1 Tax=Quercus suber TaxID=58331 RepID=A0AAW0K1C9_QUESU